MLAFFSFVGFVAFAKFAWEMSDGLAVVVPVNGKVYL